MANGAGCADGSCVLRGSNVDVEEGSVIAPRDAWISSRISARNSSLSPTWEVPSGGWREAVCAEGTWSLDAAAPAFAARLRPRPWGSRRGARARAVDERVVRFLGITAHRQGAGTKRETKRETKTRAAQLGSHLQSTLYHVLWVWPLYTARTRAPQWEWPATHH